MPLTRLLRILANLRKREAGHCVSPVSRENCECFSVAADHLHVVVRRALQKTRSWLRPSSPASDGRTHRYGLDLFASKPTQLLQDTSEHLCLLFWKISDCIHQDIFYQTKGAGGSKGDSCVYMPEIKVSPSWKDLSYTAPVSPEPG